MSGRDKTLPEKQKTNVRILSKTLTLEEVRIVTAHEISNTKRRREAMSSMWKSVSTDISVDIQAKERSWELYILLQI